MNLDVEKVKILYEQGNSLREIGKICGVAHVQIFGFMKKNNIPRRIRSSPTYNSNKRKYRSGRPERVLSDDEYESFKKDWNLGTFNKDLCKKYAMSKSFLYKTVNKLNLQYRNNKQEKEMTISNEQPKEIVEELLVSIPTTTRGRTMAMLETKRNEEEFNMFDEPEDTINAKIANKYITTTNLDLQHFIFSNLL